MKKSLLFLILYWLGGCLSGTFASNQALPDTTVLQQLYQEAMSKMMQADRLTYSTRLLEEARKKHNTKYEGNAMFLITKHYYGANLDSLFYWTSLATPLFLKEKRYEDLFRVKGWGIYALTKELKNKEALDSVSALKKLAIELDFPDGIDMANQALADNYISTGLKEEGTKLYEEILTGMESRNAPLVKRINIIRQLINRAATNQQCLQYLDRLRTYIELCKEQGVDQLDEENPLSFLEYLLHRSYAMSYTKEKIFNKALPHLKKAEEVAKKYNMKTKRTELMTVYAAYYRANGQYEKAIRLYDTLLVDLNNRKVMQSYLEMMSKKASALMGAERYKEAAVLYEQYSALNDSLSSASYYQQLAEMKTQHNVDKLELENKQMEVQALRDHNQMLFLYGGMIVLVIICCLLGYLTYTIHRFGRQLKVSKEKAEEADRLKSAFLANMNHEIRTPLNAIVGFSQILVDEEDAESRQQYFSIIQSNNELLQRLIYDVLDISKIESNTMTFSYKDIELLPLMTEIYSSTNLRMPEGVVLELKPCDNMIYRTDRSRLTQIITNLLNNAIKHTEKGFIRFGYEVIGENIHFSIEDSGEGIPEDKLESIFSRFVQLNDWNKGVGLGLAICQGLIVKMGGTIRVKSKVGEGAVFIVVLPLTD